MKNAHLKIDYDTESMEEKNQDFDVVVFPNPTKKKITSRKLIY